MAALSAFEQPPAALRPNPCALAFGASRLAAPTRLHPVRPTVLFGLKTLVELNRRLRKITPQIVVPPGNFSACTVRHGFLNQPPEYCANRNLASFGKWNDGAIVRDVLLRNHAKG